MPTRCCYCCGHVHTHRKLPDHCYKCGFRLYFSVECTRCRLKYLKKSNTHANKCEKCCKKVSNLCTIDDVRHWPSDAIAKQFGELGYKYSGEKIQRMYRLWCLRHLLQQKIIARKFYYFVQECIMTRKNVIERMVERRYKEYILDWNNFVQKLDDSKFVILSAELTCQNKQELPCQNKQELRRKFAARKIRLFIQKCEQDGILECMVKRQYDERLLGVGNLFLNSVEEVLDTTLTVEVVHNKKDCEPMFDEKCNCCIQ